MSLNPKHINRQLDRYFNGDMTGAEMHELEKLALSDVFLKDAMDGYTQTPQALQYHNKKLSKRFNSQFKFWAVSLLSIALVVMTGLYLTKTQAVVDQQEQTNADIALAVESKKFEKVAPPEIEVIPSKIETLRAIEVIDQIRTKSVKADFSTNQTYHAEKEQESDSIILIDPNELLMDEDLEVITVAKKEQKKVVYPYRYFYDMAVVDYTRFENREKLISKTVYRLSGGLDASFESQDARINNELVEQTTQVGYLDYLEETLYYFSKNRHKNALKRINIISEHYKNDLNALFYGGLCYYNLGDFKTALQEFNTILKLKEGPFTEEAMWYKAKTLIKLEKTPEAKMLLADIILFSGFYKEQAQTLLSKVNC